MPSHRDLILEDLASLSPSKFVSKYIFDTLPHVFEDRSSFVHWKDELANIIDVDAAAITVVGSSAVGISLNPYKSFKLFDGASDIDVAVVSSFHFQSAWRFLRTNGNIRYKLTPKQRNSWDKHVSGYVYWGTIATDTLLPVMPFGKQWLVALERASKDKNIGSREVNLRIYADYDSLRIYQNKSVKSSQLALLNSGAG